MLLSEAPALRPCRCDVLVIGAGMAGLAAGWKPKGYGNRVIILAARNRIGGRVSCV